MKKKLLTLVAMLFTSIIMTGCISQEEVWMRKKQLENQAKHQQTYSPFVFRGPGTLTLQQGAVIEVRSETQPFKVIDIPNGQEIQADLAKHAITTGAVGILGYKALKEASGDTKIITNKGKGK